MNRGTASPTAPKASPGRIIVLSALVVLLFVAIGALLFYSLQRITGLTFSTETALHLVVVGVLGVAAIYAINTLIRLLVTRAWGPRRAGQLSAIFRFVGYTILALALLAAAGVSALELLAGGTFAGLVLGLASQDVLSSLFAGLVLLVVTPYRIGERVTLSTWQWGLLAPAYPPKFYSQDFLVPGYTGTVKDIGMFYTTVEADDAVTMRFPNSIMIQAAVLSHELQARSVRTKYEIVAPTIEPQEILNALREAVRTNEWVVEPDSVTVMINQATANSYVVSVDAWCRGSQEEPARSSILLTMIRTVRQLAASQVTSQPGAGTKK
jgi:small conductance mechanosensitive channel